MKALILVFFSLAAFADVNNPSLCTEQLEDFKGCSGKECRKELIYEYTLNLYAPVNSTLRKFFKSRDCNAIANKLQSAISYLPPYSGDVFRGSKYTQEMQALPIGGCIQDSAFLSTSKNQAIAESFADDGVLLKINSQTGRDITELSSDHKEEEVLFQPGVILLLTNKVLAKNKVPVLEFREASRGECRSIKVIKPDVEASIKIKDSSYGMNLSSKHKGNLTEEISGNCNDENICEYHISEDNLEDDVQGDKSFQVNWSCQKGLEVIGKYSMTIPAPVSDATVEFGCTPDGQRHAILQPAQPKPDPAIVVLVSGTASTGQDVTDIVRARMFGDFHSSIHRIEIWTTYFPEGAPDSISITYKCVSKSASVTKSTILETKENSYLGFLTCTK